ncbi:hypothetical protein [Streptomyces sp. NPDC048248]|uniref:hypothetical protein n=1 Tax=Streptomyces sp. NPDC048248 TaxID=3365523 RepID=UPI00371220E2
MTTTVADQNDSHADSDEETGIETLGHANRFATWDSEFRYDGRIRVPMGVRIKAVKYSYFGTDKPDMIAASRVERGRGGIDQEYEVIDTTFLADTDVITFTLRGDLNVDTDPRPAYSRTYTIRVEVTLDDGTVRNAYPKIEVLVPNWRREGDGRMVGRPFVRLPYDTGWGGKPNSQAGFGCVSDTGLIEDRFIIDLVNPRQGESGVESNHSDCVYYQLVHEDGTASSYTPTPKKLENMVGHKGSGTEHKVLLGRINLRETGDSPGYYRFLVWPQSVDADDKVSKLSWDPANAEDAFQLGSVYYRYTAPRSAAFTVSPGGPPDVTLTPAGSIGYPGVRLDAAADGTVPRQNVRVSLPRGAGLRFVAEGNPGYQLTVQSAQGIMKVYPGTSSADGQTLTFANVDLALAGRDATSRAWVAVTATDSAPAGDTSLNFQVGDRTASSTPIHVVNQASG